MQCPCCGAHTLTRDTRDITVGDIVIKAITADFCSTCGEVILDREEGDRYAEALVDAKRKG